MLLARRAVLVRCDQSVLGAAWIKWCCELYSLSTSPIRLRFRNVVQEL